MTEREQAIKIANAILECPYVDPDGDECVLARQFLRAVERETTDARSQHYLPRTIAGAGTTMKGSG